MKITILSLFPNMFDGFLTESIIKRAIQNGKVEVKIINFRDYSVYNNKQVDDTPYGGGAGMVMRAGPVCDCYEDIVKNIGERPRVIYMTPQGYTFTQKMAEDFAKEDNLVILCGHYEGIDERALENIVTDYVSIGDYVLTTSGFYGVLIDISDDDVIVRVQFIDLFNVKNSITKIIQQFEVITV